MRELPPPRQDNCEAGSAADCSQRLTHLSQGILSGYHAETRRSNAFTGALIFKANNTSLFCSA